MKQVTINLYKFSELRTDAQEKAIESLSTINVNYEWWDFVYEDFKTIAGLLGVEVDLNKTYFEGFYHQGQGSGYTANIDFIKLVKAVKSEAWKDHAPKENFSFLPITKNMDRVFKMIEAGSLELSAFVEPANRGTSIRVPAQMTYHGEYLSDLKNIESALDNWSEFVKDAAEELNNFLFSSLLKSYDYLTSKEAIIKTIEANEYYFTGNGELSVH